MGLLDTINTGLTKWNPLLTLGGGLLKSVGGSFTDPVAEKQAKLLYELKLRELEDQEKQQAIANAQANRGQNMAGIGMLGNMRQNAYQNFMKEKYLSTAMGA